MADDLHLPSVLVAVIAVVMSLAVFVVITSRNGTPIGIYDNGIGDHWPAGHRRLTIVERTGDDGWRKAVADAVHTWGAAGSSLQMTVKTGGGGCHQSRDHIEVCLATADAIARRECRVNRASFRAASSRTSTARHGRP